MTEAFFFCLGLIFGLGVFILLSVVFTRVDGTFIIDDRDPLTTRWTLSMETDPKDIKRRKWVRMNVEIEGED